MTCDKYSARSNMRMSILIFVHWNFTKLMTSHTGWIRSPSDKLGELFVLRKAEGGFHRRQVSSESSKGNPWNQCLQWWFSSHFSKWPWWFVSPYCSWHVGTNQTILNLSIFAIYRMFKTFFSLPHRSKVGLKSSLCGHWRLPVLASEHGSWDSLERPL